MEKQTDFLNHNKDEWYTPAWITDPLGRFDLDPAAPSVPHRKIAGREYTKADDGLILPWSGRVWLNPPFSQPLLRQFVHRMAQHGNGIVLIPCRGFDTTWFQEDIFEKASAVLFLRGRVTFSGPGSRKGGHSPIGTLLVAYGKNNADILKTCGIIGTFIRLK